MSQTAPEAAVDVTEKLSSQIEHLVSSQVGCFSCGGSIPITAKLDDNGPSTSTSAPAAGSPTDKAQVDANTSKPSTGASGTLNADEKTTSKPITVRWDPPSATPGDCRSVSFPLSANAAYTGMARLQALLRDCAPATFGRGSEDVLDESYRKASKLDGSAFSTDFCPYKLGIICTAAEVLMPGVGLGWSRAVEAELYKLNVGGPRVGLFSFCCFCQSSAENANTHAV
jgi:hypothetical protein